MPLPTPIRAQGFVIWMLAATSILAQPTTNALFIHRAEQAFARAQKAYAANPEAATNAWNLGSVSFDLADLTTNMDEKASVAQTGIAACRHLLANDPQSAPGHFYLAMDYGELAAAEAPSMAAYKLIRDIEREFKAAAELDEHQDHAGPIRSLGLLYRDAPGWPISIGNKRKAREYLEQAATLAPDYPENQMNLVESYIRWRQEDEAQAAWQKLAAIWPVARTNFSGVAWEPNWSDWTTRRDAAKADFEQAFRHKLEP